MKPSTMTFLRSCALSVAFLVGCGAEDQFTDLADSNQAGSRVSDINVFIGPQEHTVEGAHQLLAGVSTIATRVSICSILNNVCAPGAEAIGRRITTGNSRHIYQFSKPVMVTEGATYQISVAADSGVIARRMFSFTQGGGITNPVTGGVSSGAQWKAVLMTGDNSIQAFDNGRRSLAQLFQQKGVRTIRQLSMNPGAGVEQSSAANLQRALGSLQLQQNDVCLLHMTSHGSRQGFFMRGQGQISPSQFNQILDSTCGQRPTVALVSACYSGVMINPQTAKSNRIILTAARNDKTSFGCGPKNQYTYWDDCLIQKMQSLDKGYTGEQLYREVYSCIERQEGGHTKSFPQAHIGASMKNFTFFN